ncbi:hypothetical protein [Coraliomargarita parva]|uniref:hypothetical protein n=1 Tax=Coraliomargarita parva TaxID=3014050 RepID=UPI0022B4B471|nr:hypothetical protein [Coraliomargarita parva]
MHKIIPLVASAAIAHTASADLVFQADFNGTGGGTGGASDIATYGGTGSIYDTAADDDISASVSGGKLVITDGSGYVGRPVGVTFDPTSIDNGFNSWFENTSDTLGYDSINGALDFYFKSTENALTGNSVRAIDTRIGQDDQFRIVVTTNVTGVLTLQILDYSSGTGTVIMAPSYNFYEYQANTLYHVAVTVETGVDGLITGKIFVAEGNTTISSSAIPSISGTTAGSVDTTGTVNDNSFRFGTSDVAVDRVLELDSFRLYDSVPAEFSAIPEPKLVGLSVGSMALLAAIGLKRKGGHPND